MRFKMSAAAPGFRPDRRVVLRGMAAAAVMGIGGRARAAAVDPLVADPLALCLGNARGDVTLAVLSDYDCPPCHRLASDLAALILRDPGVRVVYLQAPVLGPASVMAAAAVAAAHFQGRQQDLHFALHRLRGLSEARILQAAGEVGLDTATLTRAMDGSAVRHSLHYGLSLLEQVGSTGVPTLVMDGEEVDLRFGVPALQDLVAEYRQPS